MRSKGRSASRTRERNQGGGALRRGPPEKAKTPGNASRTRESLPDNQASQVGEHNTETGEHNRAEPDSTGRLSTHSGPSWQGPAPGDRRLHSLSRRPASSYVVPLLLSSLRIQVVGFFNTHRNNIAHYCFTAPGRYPQVKNVFHETRTPLRSKDNRYHKHITGIHF